MFDPGFTLEHYRHLDRGADLPGRDAQHLRDLNHVSRSCACCSPIRRPTSLVMAPPWLGTILIGFVMLPFLDKRARPQLCLDIPARLARRVNATLMRVGPHLEPLPLIFNRAGVLIGMVNILFPYTILV